ncbi:unnamed protein product [Protopolystoma xenopodis]|uniref:Uncharacterized protein n=1 Tax=Protopolystoma xenopodis TaxID=117903 RepID=A0A448XP58_9PLAT|nr:unnamed protein product [Protopolystoma xenopodis]
MYRAEQPRLIGLDYASGRQDHRGLASSGVRPSERYSRASYPSPSSRPHVDPASRGPAVRGSDPRPAHDLRPVAQSSSTNGPPQLSSATVFAAHRPRQPGLEAPGGAFQPSGTDEEYTPTPQRRPPQLVGRPARHTLNSEGHWNQSESLALTNQTWRPFCVVETTTSAELELEVSLVADSYRHAFFRSVNSSYDDVCHVEDVNLDSINRNVITELHQRDPAATSLCASVVDVMLARRVGLSAKD